MFQKAGLILSSSKYKDYDCVINVLFEDGIKSILIRGAYRAKNKNLVFTNPFIYANLEIYEGKTKGYKLKCGTIIETFFDLSPKIDQIIFLNLMIEISNKFIIEGDSSAYLHLVVSVLKGIKHHKDVDRCVSYYLLSLIKILGLQFEMNHCIRCESTEELSGISFLDGGAVCKNCLTDTDLALDKKEYFTLKKISINSDFKDFKHLSIKFLKKLNISLLLYLEDYFNVKINTLNLYTLIMG